MTRQRPRSSSSFRFLLLPLLLSFLFTLHGVFLTRNLLSSNEDAKYFNEDDDSQWRLNVMMGRGAPFDNRLDGMAADDFDVPSSPDGGGDTYDDGAPAEEQFEISCPACAMRTARIHRALQALVSRIKAGVRRCSMPTQQTTLLSEADASSSPA